MAYALYDYTKPDGGTQAPAPALTSTRQNLLALRDGIIGGKIHGWSAAPSGGTAEQPAQVLFTKGTEQLKVSFTWGTSGGASGNVTVEAWSYSANGGVAWDTIGTTNHSYDANGNWTGMAPA